LHDCHMQYNNIVFQKKSRKINGRDPLYEDDTVVDYELDSEEEW